MAAIVRRLPSKIEVEAELCSRSLSFYTRKAWSQFEPAVKYVHGRHIDVLNEHLEAVTSGDILRLLITIPPGTMKSLSTGVIWPSWEWGPRGNPAMRYVGVSHEQTLASRDAVRMRDLVKSEWYQQRWPISFGKAQDEKTYYVNTYTGYRVACSVQSITGRRGDRVVWDDPNSAADTKYPAKIAESVRIFKEVVSNRLNDPVKSAIVVVMQRLTENDVAGYILAEKLGYQHLMLPMRFEPERRCVTVLGVADWRTEPGELLFPERFPQEEVDEMERVMGPYAVAGQNQQRPAPREGGMFDVTRIKVVDKAPAVVESVRYWDKAATLGGLGARTAGVKIGRTADGVIVIEDVCKGRWSSLMRNRAIKQRADMDGVEVAVWHEQEPGSGGKESAEITNRELMGYSVRRDLPVGNKIARADPFAAQVEAGNVVMVKAPWNSEYLEELGMFPNGNTRDQTDASSGAFNKLTLKKKHVAMLLPVDRSTEVDSEYADIHADVQYW